MKKFEMMMAAAFCCAMSTTVFCSCGSDDDDIVITPEEKVATVKEVTIFITATPTADMLKYADLKVTVTDENGNEKSAVVDSEDFKVKTSYTEFPVNATVKYTQKAKEGVTANEEDVLHWNYGLLVQKEMTMSDGTKKTAEPYQRIATMDMPGQNLANYLEKRDVIAETSIIIDKDGVVK